MKYRKLAFDTFHEFLVKIGTIWAIKNKTWRLHSSFAKEKPQENFHPGLVIDESQLSGYTVAPGTSNKHEEDGVFVVKLKNPTHFLFRYSFNENRKNFNYFRHGWLSEGSIYKQITDEEVKELKTAVEKWRNNREF